MIHNLINSLGQCRRTMMCRTIGKEIDQVVKNDAPGHLRVILKTEDADAQTHRNGFYGRNGIDLSLEMMTRLGGEVARRNDGQTGLKVRSRKKMNHGQFLSISALERNRLHRVPNNLHL